MKLRLLFEMSWRRIPYDKLASRLAEATLLYMKKWLQTFPNGVWENPKGRFKIPISDEIRGLLLDVFGDVKPKMAKNFELSIDWKPTREDKPVQDQIGIGSRFGWIRVGGGAAWGEGHIELKIWATRLSKSVFSKLYDEMTEVLRHELEHLRQFAAKGPGRAQRRGLVPSGPYKYAVPGAGDSQPFYDWIASTFEIGAAVSELHFRARKKGKPFEEELRDWLIWAAGQLRKEEVPAHLIANVVEKYWDFAMKKYPGLIKAKLSLKRPEPETTGVPDEA